MKHLTIDELSEAVAAASELVDALGMLNAAQLSPDERRDRCAEYERALARLSILREDLMAAMRAEQNTLRNAAEMLAYSDLFSNRNLLR